MIKKLKPTIVLTAICLTVALLLSVINMFTSERIAENQLIKDNKTLLEVLPDGSSFEKLESTEGLHSAVTDVWKAPEGYVFKTSTKGWASGMVVMIGIDNDGKIVKTKCTASNETFGFQNKLDGAYNGSTLDTAELIIASGATQNSETSKGYYAAIQAALQSFAILGGEDVDLRTPEQILNDNCNAALGTEGEAFTKWFATEVLTGVDAVYECSAGKVFKLGDKFVGYKDGAVVGEATDEERATVEAAYAAVVGSTLTDVEKPAGASANVLTVQVTDSGNYVFTARGAGYDKNSEYSQTKSYIYIKLAISADGKILDVLTTEHHESEGYGDKCASSEFYGQLIGKDSTNHAEVEITGATKTTEGYQRALKQCFEALDLILGENSTEGEA